MWPRPATTFVNATVITERRLYTSIRVRGRTIDGLGVSPSRWDTVIDLDNAVVVPGLINAHDHLELNSFPRLKWQPRYTNVRQWIADFQPRFDSDPQLAAARPDTLTDRLWVGALKNLLSGVTTVCHHNPLHRALRWWFPIKVVRKFGLSHSLHIDGDRIAEAYRKTPLSWPWIIHAAEGVDEEARSELDTLTEMGCIGGNTVLVHGVGASAEAAARAVDRGASLIWCPTSNDFLFGRTAEVGWFDQHCRLAIGSDSRLSGEGDLLDELRAAAATRQVASQSLVRAVTSDAADILRLPYAGRLGVGAPADLTVLKRVHSDPFDSIVTAVRSDVRLTMVDGRPIVADPELRPVFRGRRPAHVRVDGKPRLLAPHIADRAAKLSMGEPGLEFAS